MNWLRKTVWATVFLGPLLVLFCLGSGCASTPAMGNPSGSQAHAPAHGRPVATSPRHVRGNGESPDLLRVGDAVTVLCTGVPDPPSKFEGRIRDDGTIYLQYIGPIKAAGSTATQLEDAIREAYVPAYYVRLTVKVNTEGRFFMVEGEVKLPNRYVYSGPTTVLGAIATAGGFTDFAKKTKVQIIRVNGHIDTVNCQKARQKPKLDLPIYPGDLILVPRRII